MDRLGPRCLFERRDFQMGIFPNLVAFCSAKALVAERLHVSGAGELCVLTTDPVASVEILRCAQDDSKKDNTETRNSDPHPTRGTRRPLLVSQGEARIRGPSAPQTPVGDDTEENDRS